MRTAIVTGALVTSMVLTSSLAAQETTYRWLYMANLSTCTILDTNQTLSDIKRLYPKNEIKSLTSKISGNSMVAVLYDAGTVEFNMNDENYFGYFVTQGDCEALKKAVDADRGKN
jgi:hypothetical protein